MRAFKNTWFSRFADKEGITDYELKEAVSQLEAGQADANLGGDVYKVRIARPGEGKSGGYRAVVLFKKKERSFFEYAFPKSVRDNISEKELRNFKKMAKAKLALSDSELTSAVNDGDLIEI